MSLKSQDVKRKKSKSGLAIALLVSAMFSSILIASNFPDAHASGPALSHTASTTCGSVATCPTTLNIATGDLIVVISHYGASFSISQSGVTDTIGNSFHRATVGTYIPGAAQCGNPSGNLNDEIWYAISSGSNGADVVTVHLSGITNCNFDTTIVSFTGASTFALDGTGTGHCSSTCGTSLSTSSASFINSNYVLVSGAYGAPYSFPFTSGGCSYGSFSTGHSATTGWCYSVPGVGFPSDPTTFPMFTTLPGGGPVLNWGEVGAAFDAPPTTTTSSSTSTGTGQTVVIACTWYQEQCWLFPIMFLALFSTFWVAIGAASKVSTRGMTYILMSSVTYGTIIEIMMGMLSSELLILIIVIDVVYAIGFSALF
jgi:hypothetical protein